jgi:hypothetical protein
MFDFPNNPSDGQQVIHPNGSTYTYQSNAWVVDRDGLAELTTRINLLETQSLFLLE